jgi:homoserine kinase
MPTVMSGPATVSVPATSANLGPGFDALGLALDLRDTVTVEVAGDVAAGQVAVTVCGAGADTVPLDEGHLVFRAMLRAFDQMACEAPGIRLHCMNSIPHGRGLGSSSAAIVSGLCAARALVAGGSLLMDDDAVFDLAAAMEGHPDNVAPAFYGGFTIAWAGEHRFRATAVTVDPRIRAVVFVPPQPLATTVARGLLPSEVSHRDAAANSGRAALLVAALSTRPELLLDATRDYLHQEQRVSAMPETLRLVHSLRAEGLPAVISGAGPTVLVLTDATEEETVADRVPEGWQAHRLAIDGDGAKVRLPG